MRRHGDTTGLCLSQSCLKFQIVSRAFCQKALPLGRAIVISPGKKLASFEPVCGNLEEPVAAVIHVRYVFGGAPGYIKEVVYLLWDILVV